MERRTDVKGLLLIVLAVAVVLMAVGYASLATTLTVKGTASIADANWDVKITSIAFDAANSLVSSSDSTQSFDPAEAAVGAGSTGAKFNVTLNKPGDYATYTIVVTNKGTIDAELDDITDLTTINAAAPTDIVFNVTPAVGNAAVLTAGATHTYTVQVGWKAEATEIDEENTSKTATIYFDYVQAN